MIDNEQTNFAPTNLSATQMLVEQAPKSATKRNTLLLLIGISTMVISLVYFVPIVISKRDAKLSTQKQEEAKLVTKEAKENLSIPKIDSDWHLPDKNRLYSLRSTRSKYDLKSDDICYITVSKFLSPETERVLTAIKFTTYEGNQPAENVNHVMLIASLEGKLIVYISEHIKPGEENHKLIAVDTANGEQEIVSDNVAIIRNKYDDIFVDRGAKAIYFPYDGNLKIGRYSLQSKEKQIITFTPLTNEPTFGTVVAKINDSRLLIRSLSGMAAEEYSTCAVSANNECVLKRYFPIEQGHRVQGTFSPNNQALVINEDSGEYYPLISMLKIMPDISNPIFTTLLETSNNWKVNLDPPPTAKDKVWNHLDKFIISPTGKSIITTVVQTSTDSIYKPKGIILDKQNISSQEKDFISNFNSNTDQALYIWNLLSSDMSYRWVAYVDDNDVQQLGFISNGYSKPGKTTTSLGFYANPFESKVLTPLNLPDSGANAIQDYLLDP